jgi:TPR repeat protein
VKKDESEAVYWHKKASSKNDAKAFFNLGMCYKYGEGVNESKRWAKFYFSKAKTFGHKGAAAQLKELK